MKQLKLEDIYYYMQAGFRFYFFENAITVWWAMVEDGEEQDVYCGKSIIEAFQACDSFLIKTKDNNEH